MITYPTSSCTYVQSYRLSWGCVSSDNPLGYYYTVVYRTGYSTNPRSPSWRACWQGYIHVCAQFDTRVMTMPVCGFPPSQHPLS